MKGFQSSPEMSSRLKQLIPRLCDPEKICVSIADTSYGLPLYAGHNDEMFVYPASLYKLYVAAALMGQVGHSRIFLDQEVVVSRNNTIDQAKEIPSDTRALLQAGQHVSVRLLLDLMITRSDNTAANVLIDLVGREYIRRFVAFHGWYGSEVTRKFLPRSREDDKYCLAKPTVTTTLHLTELLHFLQEEEAGLCALLTAQLDMGKIRAGLPSEATFAHKTGWYSLETKDGKTGVVGDCGIVRFNEVDSCAVACIVLVPDPEGSEILTQLGREIQGIIANVI